MWERQVAVSGNPPMPGLPSNRFLINIASPSEPIAVNQKNPKIIYAGTGESNMRNSVSIGDGFYKSTDGGDNWTKTGCAR